MYIKATNTRVDDLVMTTTKKQKVSSKKNPENQESFTLVHNSNVNLDLVFGFIFLVITLIFFYRAYNKNKSSKASFGFPL